MIYSVHQTRSYLFPLLKYVSLTFTSTIEVKDELILPYFSRTDRSSPGVPLDDSRHTTFYRCLKDGELVENS